MMSPSVKYPVTVGTEHFIVRQVLTVGHSADEYSSGRENTFYLFQAKFQCLLSKVLKHLGTNHHIHALCRHGEGHDGRAPGIDSHGGKTVHRFWIGVH